MAKYRKKVVLNENHILEEMLSIAIPSLSPDKMEQFDKILGCLIETRNIPTTLAELYEKTKHQTHERRGR